MSDRTRVARPLRRARPSATRTAAAAIATAALAMLAAACGSPSSGAGSSNAGGPVLSRSADSLKGLAYSRCMRSHGVPRYPDASSSNELANGLPKVDRRQLGVSSSQYQAAQSGCAHLLPNGGQPTQSQSQRDLRAMLSYARCMRSHGVPTWPDPTDGSAGWGFNLVGVHGFDPNSAQVNNKMDNCNRGLPPGIGVPLSRPGRPG